MILKSGITRAARFPDGVRGVVSVRHFVRLSACLVLCLISFFSQITIATDIRILPCIDFIGGSIFREWGNEDTLDTQGSYRDAYRFYADSCGY